MKHSYVFLFFLLQIYLLAAQSEKDIQNLNIQSVKTKIWDADKPKNNEMSINRYDKKGNLIELIEFDKDSIPQKWEQYTYNGAGNLIEEKKLDETGKIKKTNTLSYNRLGKKTEEILANTDGKIISKTTYSYNGFEQKESEIKTDEDGNIKEKNLYEYDNKGMLISKKTYNKKGELIYSKVMVYGY